MVDELRLTRFGSIRRYWRICYKTPPLSGGISAACLATLLGSNEIPLSTIQSMLRHSKPQATFRYFAVNSKQLKVRRIPEGSTLRLRWILGWIGHFFVVND